MSILEKCLWTVLTIGAAFFFISLLTDDLQPHRFFFGVPFSVSILAVMSSLSILFGGGVMQGLASVAPESFVRRSWWLTSALMCLRCFVGGSRSEFADAAINILLCSTTALFALLDIYQRSSSWPKFDVPEIGRPPVLRRSIQAQVDRGNSRNWFGVLSCIMAVFAVYRLLNGLDSCLGNNSWSDSFFISELGAGKHADLFTATFLSFGVFMVPFFTNFLVGYNDGIPAEALKFAAGGCLAVCGIIGVGAWDLQHPMHYFSLGIWLLALTIILDQYVPTPRGFVDLRFPTWLVKACMAAYVMTMIVLPFGEDAKAACITSQRLVVLATLAWLFLLWKVVAAESLGVGKFVNGEAFS